MRTFNVTRTYLYFMYMMDITLLAVFAWTWYQYKAPLVWMAVLTGMFSILIVALQSIHIASLYLFILKDNTLQHSDDHLEEDYQFIKGLY
ncbi:MULTISPECIES: hypothetical protein [unclassified Sphingobacterium]|uniref:hypothetical protein n=1 Tax=unclassified Sphingobacterium TaxID=2609468 RepID=UPI0025F32A6B|nr:MULTISPECIES: hypothetical protein [unclassified Sphingobacterium]